MVEPLGKSVGIAVSGIHLAGAGGRYGLIEALPVGMVTEHKATVGSPAAAGAAQGHPAGGNAQ